MQLWQTNNGDNRMNDKDVEWTLLRVPSKTLKAIGWTMGFPIEQIGKKVIFLHFPIARLDSLLVPLFPLLFPSF
jgi:hypothetical protein